MTAACTIPTQPASPRGRWSLLLAPVLMVCSLLALIASPSVARAQLNVLPEEAKGLEITEHLGQRIPLDLEFVDDTGQTVKLGQYFSQGPKPVILALVYFRCPLLCPLMLSKISDSINKLDLNLGEKYNLVLVSFDPTEGTDAAAVQKAGMLAGYDRPHSDATANGLAVLTGHPLSARGLADAVGFPYKFLPKSGEYSHGTVIFVLTPDGTISRYLYGVDYPVETLRMALLEASDGKIGTTLDRFIMWCFHYDPSAGGYVVQAMRVMQIGAVLCSIAVLGVLGGMVAIERRRRAALREAALRVMTQQQPPPQPPDKPTP